MPNYRIILVENDEDELLFMKEAFDTSPLFTVLNQMKNGNELFEWLENEPASSFPDLILSDLNMPGKNGYDILIEMKQTQKYAHLPVVITSTSSVQSIMDRCLALNARGFLVKPETFLEYDAYVTDLYAQIVKNHWISLS